MTSTIIERDYAKLDVMNIFAVDLGGTNTRIARFDGLGSATMMGEPVRRRNTHDYGHDLGFIVDSVRRLSDGQPVDAIGIGVGGGMNAELTEVASARNLPEWVGRPFVAELAKELDCAVYADNDGLAAAWGEIYFGHVSGNFHYLVWGTGISGVRVERRGDEVTAARLDWREHYKRWELACSGAAIEREYGRPGEQLTASDWLVVTAQFGEYLRDYVAATRPEKIIFGGGLALHHAQTIAAQQDAAGIPLITTEFGLNSGLVGALALVRRGENN